MKCLILYAPGPNYDPKKIGDHIRYLKSIYFQKQNLLNGPLLGDLQKRGIALLDVPSLEEAITIRNNDPAVINDCLVANVYEIKAIFDAIGGNAC